MMLDPNQRTNFLDLLRPPSGYRLDSAVGTTYSMDFVALTAVMLAFVDAEVESESGRPNDVEVLRAITRLADRVRLFVDRTHINASDVGRHGKLSSLYDRVVHEIAFEKGSFHPKVWVVRYEPKTSAEAKGSMPLVRVICASRNLTTSACWDVFAAFEGHDGNNQPKNGFAIGVAQFLGKLRRLVKGDAGLLTRLEEALSRVEIEVPQQLGTRCEFLWQWNEGPALWGSFPWRGTRVLVVSPFVQKDFLSSVLRRFDQIILVSTQSELDALSDAFYGELSGKKHKLFVVRSAEAEDGSAAMQLHAKVFICETPEDKIMFLGSANASDRAWRSRNCEAMVALSPGMSIDQFCSSFIYTPKQSAGPYRGWIEPYERSPVVEDEEALGEQELEDIRNLLAGLELRASYNQQSQVLRIQCLDLTQEPKINETLNKCCVRLCLLSRFERESDLIEARGIFTDGVEFCRVRIAELTEFMVLDVSHPSSAHIRFVVMAKTDFSHLREERNVAVLNEFLTADSFQQFLRAILFDETIKGLPVDSAKISMQKSGDETTWTLPGDTTLENVLESCTEDPSRIEEINQLLKVFEGTKVAGQDFEQFRKIWRVFLAACHAAKGAADV